MPYTLSPSSLNLFKECPRCFWLHHNKKIKRPEAIFPSLPSGMDRVLKQHFDRSMKKQQLPPELQALNGEVKLFDNEELLTIWRNNRKGIQYTDNQGNLLRGAIDNLLIKNNKLVVLDYKTRGFPLKEDTAEHYQDQINIYHFLLRKNNYKTEQYAYLLFYHPHEVLENGHVCFNTDLIKLKVNVRNAQRLFQRAIKLLQENLPKAAENCGFCTWKKTTVNSSSFLSLPY